MCGINGFIIKNTVKSDKKTLLTSMNESIKYRGPDDSGLFIEEKDDFSVGLGHLRLSIIDLSDAGHQPMFYDKLLGASSEKWNSENTLLSNISLTFNGEIYNFQELKIELQNLGYFFSTKTDTEIILASYLEWGEKCVEKFNGMWAFVIYDKSKNILFGSRDRFGKKPLKYYYDKESFIFSSELKAILNHDIKREIDLDAINYYLTLQFVPNPKTGFKNIFKLPHASNFVYDISLNTLSIKKYWDLDYSEKIKVSDEEIIKDIETKFDESIKKRMIADVDIGAFLSGGIDSSAIVAFASKYKKNLKTFTVKFSEKGFDESEYAKKVSEYYKTDHREFLVESRDMLDNIEKLVFQYEEPYADMSQLPTFILSQKTSQFVKVVLNGDGGDENFAGYDKYDIHLKSSLLKKLPFKFVIIFVFKLLCKLFKHNNFLHKSYLYFFTLQSPIWERHLNYTNYFDTFSKDSLFKDDVNTLLTEKTIDVFSKVMTGKEDLPYLDNILYLDFNTYLPDDLMVKVDIATMANGIESRSPLLDYKFVEYCAKIDYDKKIIGGKRKVIFKKMLEKYLSKDILYRKKKGFAIPIDYWFRYDLKDYITSVLFDEKGLCLKLFKKEKIVELFEQHMKGKDNGKRLWSLMVLNIWYKKYFINK